MNGSSYGTVTGGRGASGDAYLRITDYSFGRITIDRKIYTSDVIIYPGRVQDSWWRRDGHRLYPDDVKDAVDASPRVLIVGTGYYGNMTVPKATRQHLEAQGIEVYIAPTAEAVDLFNTMRDSAAVVAAFHLTC